MSYKICENNNNDQCHEKYRCYENELLDQERQESGNIYHSFMNVHPSNESSSRDAKDASSQSGAISKSNASSKCDTLHGSADYQHHDKASLSSSSCYQQEEGGGEGRSRGERKTPSVSVTVSCEGDEPGSHDVAMDTHQETCSDSHQNLNDPSNLSSSCTRRSSRDSVSSDHIILRQNSCKSHSVITDRKSSRKSSSASDVNKSLSSSLTMASNQSGQSPNTSLTTTLTKDAPNLSPSPTPSLPSTSPLHYVISQYSASPSQQVSHPHHSQSQSSPQHSSSNNLSSFRHFKRSPLSRSRSGGIFSNPFKR